MDVQGQSSLSQTPWMDYLFRLSSNQVYQRALPQEGLSESKVRSYKSEAVLAHVGCRFALVQTAAFFIIFMVKSSTDIPEICHAGIGEDLCNIGGMALGIINVFFFSNAISYTVS